MKGNRFNFFQSPNPTHFNLNILQDCKFQNPEDHQIHDQRLFSTPVRLNHQVFTSPSPQMDPQLISSHPRARPSQDIFADLSVEIQNQQLLQQSNRAIQEKLQFSEEEDLLIHLTPLKAQKVEQEPQQVTTVKRPSPVLMTPMTQSRNTERGLKKLASEAYKFVSQQKRTTYKQVARKLIGQLGEDGDIDPSVHLNLSQKKGEMNIKRRVYDALNVLIALGLLKRSGNKIMGKKIDSEDPTTSKSFQKEKQQRFKQEMMEKELSNLKLQYQKRVEIMAAKRKHQREVRQKVERLRELIKKNTTVTQNQPHHQDKIPFPMIMLCQRDTTQENPTLKDEKKQVFEEDSQEENGIKIWQKSDQDFYCNFSTQKLEIMGELDLVSRWKGEEKAKTEKRTDRIRRKPK